MDEDFCTSGSGRSQRPYDVLFWRGDGVVEAFPWADLRQWAFDVTGRRLVFVWPRNEVSLTGRHLDQLAEEIQYRRLTELRQATPEQAAEDDNGKPVIEIIEVETNR